MDPDGSILSIDPYFIFQLTLQLISFIVCIIFSAFFSASETAFLSVNKIRMLSRAEEGSHSAARVLDLLEDKDRLITTILVGNNIVNLSASAISTSMVIGYFGPSKAGIATGIATGIVTLLILVFGEITPKNLAVRHAESVAQFISPIIRVFRFILYPIVFCMLKLSVAFLHVTGRDKDDETPDFTEEELMTMVNISHEQGVLQNEEKSMLHKVFSFGDGLVKEIMTPRVNVAAVDDEWSYGEIMDMYREHQFSRMPVYHENPDHIVGILNIKDLALANVNEESFDIRDHIREAVICYDFKDIREAFDRMRRERTGLAIACDEYGIMTGIVTMEDILEEIVGDITDEYDDEGGENPITQENDGSFTMDGSVSLDAFNEKAGSALDSEQVESVGGFVLGLLDDLPEEGMVVDYAQGNVVFTIRKVDNNRITSLSAIYTPPKNTKKKNGHDVNGKSRETSIEND